jgi:hypothetical protein
LIQVIISTGLAAVRRNADVASVKKGAWSEVSYTNVWSVTCGFVLTESVSRIIIQSQTYKTSIRPSSVQRAEASEHNVNKRTWVFTSFFFQNQFFSITPIRILQHLKSHWAMSVSFPTKCVLFHEFIPLSSRNIQGFRISCAKFKYPTE